MSKTRSPLVRGIRIVVIAVVCFVGVIALAGGGLWLSRPYWDMKGNFWINFDFDDPDELFAEVEKSRAEQKALAAGEKPVEIAAAIVADEPAFATWPTYRGARRDGVYKGGGLLSAWPEGGPPEVYRQPIGAGHAAFVIGGGRAYTIEQRREKEVVTCYDFETGIEIWAHAYDAAFSEQMGGDGPRATPTLDEGRIYSLGALGDFRCLDVATGELIFEHNILRETKSDNLEWGTAGAPLVVEEKVILASTGLGGDSILAYEKTTGELLWTSLPEQQGFSSLMDVALAGRRQVLNLAAENLNGIDIETGRKLWSFPWYTQNGINCSQPVVIGPGQVFVSSGYGHGCALVEIEATGEGFAAREIWINANMKNKFNSSVLYDGHIYGLDEGVLVCIDVATGKKMWKSGRYGHGQLLLAEGNLIVMGEKGILELVKATPEGHETLGSVQALRGKAWNNPALADGRLLVRNSKEMVCYDLRG